MKIAAALFLVLVLAAAGLTGCSSYEKEPDAGNVDTMPGGRTGEAECSAAERIHSLLLETGADEEERFHAILDALPDIDWTLYSKQYGTVGDDAAGAMDLLEWLSDSPLTAQGDNMYRIFQATKGLDGVMAEQYGIIVGEFYRSGRERFVKLLARLDEQSIEEVCRLTAYNNYYHVEPEEAKKTAAGLIEQTNLSDSERFVVDTLISAFDSYITEDSP
jgi:hypothetical protein